MLQPNKTQNDRQIPAPVASVPTFACLILSFKELRIEVQAWDVAQLPLSLRVGHLFQMPDGRIARPQTPPFLRQNPRNPGPFFAAKGTNQWFLGPSCWKGQVRNGKNTGKAVCKVWPGRLAFSRFPDALASAASDSRI